MSSNAPKTQVPSPKTPEERLQDARSRIDAAVEDLAAAWTEYRRAMKERLQHAYRAGGGGFVGTKCQLEISAGRDGTATVAKGIARAMRRLKLDAILDVARTR